MGASAASAFDFVRGSSRIARLRALALQLASAGLIGACAERSSTDPSTGSSSLPSELGLRAMAGTASIPPSAPAGDPGESSDESAGATAEGSSCPRDMLPVTGHYCSNVLQVCSKQLSGFSGHPTRSERCLEYQAPTVCAGARSELRFCIDRFEWPNRAGEKPLVLVSWQEASELCATAGKRLCDEQEWTLACEGEQTLPYTLGYERPSGACAIDLPYREPKRALLSHSACAVDARCELELARLDQRRPAFAESSCKSPFGVIDMNGNVNEWVNAVGSPYPHRGALKGGWWGPVRNRCRPAVHQHREDHWGYEIGFRCCRNELDTPSTMP